MVSDQYLDDLRTVIGTAKQMLYRDMKTVREEDVDSSTPHVIKVSGRFNLYKVPTTDEDRERLRKLIADFEVEEQAAMDRLGIG